MLSKLYSGNMKTLKNSGQLGQDYCLSLSAKKGLRNYKESIWKPQKNLTACRLLRILMQQELEKVLVRLCLRILKRS